MLAMNNKRPTSCPPDKVLTICTIVLVTLFFILLAPLQCLAQGSPGKWVYGLLIDCSDGMNRPMANGSMSSTVGQVAKQIVDEEFFQANASRHDMLDPNLNNGTIPDSIRLSIRHLGGARDQNDRSCTISNDYYSFDSRGSGCMLSDWSRHASERPGALRRIADAWRNGGSPLGGADSDHSILGLGLTRFLEDALAGNNGVKLLFITDGGESCSRDSASTHMTIRNAVDVLNSFLNSHSGVGSRIAITIIGFGVVDPQAQDRLHDLRLAIANKGARYAYLKTTPSDPTQARSQLRAEISRFISASEMNYRVYSPCESCYPTRQNNCDCCFFANLWRAQCAWPECSPEGGGPQWDCTEWKSVPYTDSTGTHYYNVCNHWEKFWCPDIRHTDTIWCGHRDHTCGTDVGSNGECALNTCEFCAKEAGGRRLYYPNPVYNPSYYINEVFSGRNYVDAHPACFATARCGLTYTPINYIPLDADDINSQFPVDQRGARTSTSFSPVTNFLDSYN